jgi:hypothetical protein
MNERQYSTWASAQQAIPRRDVRTFTPSWTGFSVDPVGSVAYVDLGEFAILSPSNSSARFVGTSNAASFQMAGLPEAIRPNGTISVQVIVFDSDAATGSLGTASIASSGTITFTIADVSGAKLTYSSTNFANTGDKGWLGMIIYPMTQ